MPRRENKSRRAGGTPDKGQALERGVFFTDTIQEIILYCTGEAITPISPIPVGTVAYIDDGSIAFTLKSFQSLVFPIRRKVKIITQPTVFPDGTAGTLTYENNPVLRFQVASDIDNLVTDFSRFITEVQCRITSTWQITGFDNIGFPYYTCLENPNNDENLITVERANQQFGRTYFDFIRQDNLNNAYSGYPRQGHASHVTVPANCGIRVTQFRHDLGNIGTARVTICFRENPEPSEQIKDLISISNHNITHSAATPEIEIAIIDVRKYMHAGVAITQDAGGTLVGTWFLDEYNEIIPAWRTALHIDNGNIPAANAFEVDVGSCFMRYAKLRYVTTGGAGIIRCYIDGTRQ